VAVVASAAAPRQNLNDPQSTLRVIVGSARGGAQVIAAGKWEGLEAAMADEVISFTAVARQANITVQ
jgi:hypothetical protein